MTDTVEAPTKATKTGWKKAAVHTICLPSNVYVDIRIPDLPALIEAGEIPQNLLDTAIQVATGTEVKPSKELLIQQRQFTDRLVQLSVVDPKLTDEDLPDIPFEDKEMIVAIATRERDFDALGHQLAGLHKSEDFRKFRGLDRLDTGVEDY